MGNRNKRVRLLFHTMLILAVLFVLSGISAKAEEKTVKVGYFLMSGYQEKTEEGNRWGFGYDFLQEVAKYTGWKYEFVDATWEECEQMLENGELDLMTYAKRSPEALEKFNYSSYRMGLFCSTLTVRIGNDEYSYNDFTSFDGMKVGMLEGGGSKTDLHKLYENYGITMEEYIYNTEQEMLEALNSGQIDAIVSGNQRILENEKIIAQFNLVPYFAITKKDNGQLIQEFDSAVEQILLSNPYFEVQLSDKYFGENMGFKIAPTIEEKQYAKEHNNLRATVLFRSEPMCCYDGKKYTGIVIETLEKIAEEAGMKLEYVPTDSNAEAMKLLNSGKIDVIGDFYYDYSWAERNGVMLTRSYTNVEYMEVSSGREVPDQDKIRVAAVRNSFFNNMYTLKKFPEENIIYFDTETECMEAVRRGQAEIAYINEYAAKVLLEKDRYLNLNSGTLYNTKHGISVAVPKSNKLLYQVMNKAVSNIEPSVVRQTIESNMMQKSEKVSLISYIYYNAIESVFILCIFLSIVLVILLYIMFVKRKYNKHIFSLAYVDMLTGLNNSVRFEELVEKRWLEYRGKEIFILSFDISHFTTINETYGRNVGDCTICYVGEKLKQIYGDDGIIARNKVDNFLVFGIYTKNKEYGTLISRIEEEINVFQYQGNDIFIKYNFGVVCDRGTSSTSIKKLIDRAEMARKAAKNDSIHIRYFNDEMEEQLLREKMIEDCMQNALENGEFKVYYQPKYCMYDSSITGAEALVRWENKEYGFMSPDEFIPIFENNGFVVEMDFFVMEQVYRMLRTRIDNGERVVRVSINQSRIHFAQKNYLERLNALRNKYNIPQELIELELTESIFASMADISKIVGLLKENGYSLSVDDFGSGYSSLNMLKQIPLDTLKIDKAFLSSEDESGRYQKVIRKVVELAKDLNMEIICEGVEKEEQAQFLQSVGCMYAQGYLYAKPMPEEEFLKLL